MSPFLYSEHLGSPPPAHMGSLPYNLDPHKGPVGNFVTLKVGKMKINNFFVRFPHISILITIWWLSNAPSRYNFLVSFISQILS